jgi:hypothetical protein
MKHDNPTPGDKFIDSRDVIARIEELTDERKDLVDEIDAAESDDEKSDAQTALDEWDGEYAEELKDLKALASECEGYGDWSHGEQLIHEDAFKEYAQDLAEDIGSSQAVSGWPYTCIDWDKAADQLKVDYTCAEFAGHTYWMRA